MNLGDSLINSKIQKFYSSNWNARRAYAFNNDRSYDFHKIVALLTGRQQQAGAQDNTFFYNELQHFEYDDFLKCYDKLLPLFLATESLLDELRSDELVSLRLKWLGPNQAELQKAVIDNVGDLSAFAQMEQVLLLTSILEKALGNIFHTLAGAQRPPHLLKDLLSTQALKEFFGVDAIIFLKILLGNAKSINLRNIVWHGFPQYNEIPSYYAAVLVLTLHSLGCQLAEREREEASNFCLKHRALISDFSAFLVKYEDFTALLPDRSVLLKAIEQFDMLSSKHALHWDRLAELYRNGAYWRFVLLVLPQIELLLRLLYRCANAGDVTAKLDEYYITLDTIFEEELPQQMARGSASPCLKGKRNAVFELISVGALKCLYDLFIAPGGPRLRDKVSHGEVDLAAIDNAHLCGILWRLSLNLMAQNDEAPFPLREYESKYHLNCLTREALQSAEKLLNMLRHKHRALLEQGQELPLPIGRQQAGQASIFERPKKESELMLLLLQIAKHLQSTCRHYDEAFEERLRQRNEHGLHSKRRATLAKQIHTFPVICAGLGKLLNSLDICFDRMQAGQQEGDSGLASINKQRPISWSWCPTNVEKMLKFLKHTLQISENLARYSHKQSNEWIKALDLCKKFEELHERYFQVV